VTLATAIMYAFAPVSLTALRRVDAERERPYHLPVPSLLSPIAFIAANLIIYWSGFEANWKLLIAMAFGLVLFAITWVATSADNRPALHLPNFIWVPPWLIGMTVIGYLGRYGKGSSNVLPDWIDLLVVTGFALVIFFWAVSLAVGSEWVAGAVDAERDEIEGQPDLAVG
ncbi:MAG: hypothetical protein ACR2KL_05875, partial [Nocardioidaceae bacterium]